MSSPENKISDRDIYNVLREQIDGKDPSQSFLAELEIDAESLVIEGKFFSYLHFKCNGAGWIFDHPVLRETRVHRYRNRVTTGLS